MVKKYVVYFDNKGIRRTKTFNSEKSAKKFHDKMQGSELYMGYEKYDLGQPTGIEMLNPDQCPECGEWYNSLSCPCQDKKNSKKND